MDDIKRYFTEVQRIAANMPCAKIAEVTDLLFEAWSESRRIFICGNGGSASTASHFACDLGKGTAVGGQPRFKVIALTDNLALISAWANDATYDDIFAEQLMNLVEPEDVVIGISGSGNSPNVLIAMITARSAGAKTVGFTGFQGGKLKHLVDHCIIVPSTNMGQIEDYHLMLGHCISQNLRELIATRSQESASIIPFQRSLI
jgi:D-sedoheptulose 7-phosphate isomerase